MSGQASIVTVRAERVGEGQLPWQWAIYQGASTEPVRRSGPRFATSFEAMDAGNAAAAPYRRGERQRSPGPQGWT